MQDAGHTAIRAGDDYKKTFATVTGLVRDYVIEESVRQGKPHVGKDLKADLLGLSTKLSHYNDDKIQPCNEALLLTYAAWLDREGRLETTIEEHIEVAPDDETPDDTKRAHVQSFLGAFRSVVADLSGNTYTKKARLFRKRLHEELDRLAKQDSPTEPVRAQQTKACLKC